MHGAAVHIHPARSLREAFKIEKKSVKFFTLFFGGVEGVGGKR